MENKENLTAFTCVSNGNASGTVKQEICTVQSENVGSAFEKVMPRTGLCLPEAHHPIARRPLSTVNNVKENKKVATKPVSVAGRSQIPLPKSNFPMGNGAFKPVKMKSKLKGKVQHLDSAKAKHKPDIAPQTLAKHMKENLERVDKPDSSNQKMKIDCSTSNRPSNRHAQEANTQTDINDIGGIVTECTTSNEIELLRTERNHLQEQLIVLKLHECQVQNLQRKLEVKDYEIEELGAERDRLKMTVTEQVHGLNAMQQEKQQYQEIIRQHHLLQDQLQVLQSNTTEAEEFMQLERVAGQEELVAVIQELQISKEQLQETTQKLDEARSQVDQLEREVNEWRSKSSLADEKLQQIQEELDSTKLKAHSMLLQQGQEIDASLNATCRLSTHLQQLCSDVNLRGVTWEASFSHAASGPEAQHEGGDSAVGVNNNAVACPNNATVDNRQSADTECESAALDEADDIPLCEKISNMELVVDTISSAMLQIEQCVQGYCSDLRLKVEHLESQIDTLTNQHALMQKQENQLAQDLSEKVHDLKYVRELLQTKTEALAATSDKHNQLQCLQTKYDQLIWQLREKDAECMALRQSLDLAAGRAACGAPGVAQVGASSSSQAALLLRDNQRLQCELSRAKVRGLERQESADKHINRLVKHNQVLRDNQKKADNELMRIDALMEQIITLLREHKDTVLGWSRAEAILKNLI